MEICGKSYHVYIVTNRPYGTLYIGMTSDLPQRLWQHRTGYYPGFTRRYNLCVLVHVETYDDAEAAVLRERRLKEWHRAWKIRLIEESNPAWLDLAGVLGVGETIGPRPA